MITLAFTWRHLPFVELPYVGRGPVSGIIGSQVLSLFIFLFIRVVQLLGFDADGSIAAEAGPSVSNILFYSDI